MLQAIAHLPLIALELLRHLRHRQGADSCAVILDTLVLTRSTALLHFHAISVTNARNSDLAHNTHNLKCS